MKSNQDKPWLDWPEDKLKYEIGTVTRFTGRYLQPLIESGEFGFKYHVEFKTWAFEREGFIERTPDDDWKITEYGERWVREKVWTTHVTNTKLLLKAYPTYSGDRVPEHRIKKPISYDGRLWIATSASGVAYDLTNADENAYVGCYQVVDPADYHGDPPPRDKDACYFGKYGYMGVVVYHSRQRYVITGHRLIIHRGEPVPQQQSLFWEAAA
jgi:hypothetical protein